MTANASRLAKTFAAAALFATAITGVTAGAASAAPLRRLHPPAQQHRHLPPRRAMNVRMTVVNTTDEALTVGAPRCFPARARSWIRTSWITPWGSPAALPAAT